MLVFSTFNSFELKLFLLLCTLLQWGFLTLHRACLHTHAYAHALNCVYIHTNTRISRHSNPLTLKPTNTRIDSNAHTVEHTHSRTHSHAVRVAYSHTHTYTLAHWQAHSCMHMRTFVHTQNHTCSHNPACIHTRARALAYTCTHACICTSKIFSLLYALCLGNLKELFSRI